MFIFSKLSVKAFFYDIICDKQTWKNLILSKNRLEHTQKKLFRFNYLRFKMKGYLSNILWFI